MTRPACLIVCSGDARADEPALDEGARWAGERDHAVVVLLGGADPHAHAIDLATPRRRMLGARGAPLEVVSVHGALSGRAIASVARARDAAMIVVGEPRGDGAMLAGLLGRAPTPVLISRPRRAEPHVVVGTDLKDSRFPALHVAEDEAHRRDAALTVVHAVEPITRRTTSGPSHLVLSSDWQRERLEGAERQLRRALWKTQTCADMMVVEASAREAVREVARGVSATLVVVGTRAHGAHRRPRPGTTAIGIAREAPCSVLVVPLDPLP